MVSKTSSTPTEESHTALRVLAGLVALPATAFTLLALRSQLVQGIHALGLIVGSAIATVALVCWWIVFRGHLPGSRARIRYALIGAAILGGLGFVGGFVGPILLSPGANQGPLAGIFITGPIGVVLGAMIGWFVGLFRRVDGQAGRTIDDSN
jgi:hypothetical protein